MMTLVLVIMLCATSLSCAGGSDAQPTFTAVHIGPAIFTAELALTTRQRVAGLGGRDSLAPDAAMLFVFPTERRESFWMKDMRFPLDFVWISADKHVVEISENVPPPSAGVNDSELPLYRPDLPVQYVLEINGGLVHELGISAGDTVTFQPDVDTSRAE